MARSAILRHSVRLYGTTEPESIGQAVSSGFHPPVQSGHRRSHQPRAGRRAWAEVISFISLMSLLPTTVRLDWHAAMS
jgi:hypothetical protein